MFAAISCVFFVSYHHQRDLCCLICVFLALSLTIARAFRSGGVGGAQPPPFGALQKLSFKPPFHSPLFRPAPVQAFQLHGSFRGGLKGGLRRGKGLEALKPLLKPPEAALKSPPFKPPFKPPFNPSTFSPFQEAPPSQAPLRRTMMDHAPAAETLTNPWTLLRAPDGITYCPKTLLVRSLGSYTQRKFSERLSECIGTFLYAFFSNHKTSSKAVLGVRCPLHVAWPRKMPAAIVSVLYKVMVSLPRSSS